MVARYRIGFLQDEMAEIKEYSPSQELYAGLHP